jgi:polysaccharide deacetylase 2 family uncharacterized protein YibQ
MSIVVGVLLFVTSQAMRSGHVPVLPAVPTSECSGRLAELPAQIDRVTSALAQAGLPLSEPVEESQGSGPLRWVMRRYEARVAERLTVDALKQRLDPVAAEDPCVSVAVTPEGAGLRAQIGIDGLLTHSLLVKWETPAPQHVRVAIIMDDLGNDLRMARELAGIDAPLAFSVMPFRPFSREVAELAHLFGREVLLHLPMESDGGEDFGESQLLRVDQSEAQITALLVEALQSVPYVIGANNHMGSRFTRDRERMGWVLSWLKARRLFFVDSVTTSDSVVAEVAAAVGEPLARRSVFLDDVQEEGAIRDQLASVVKLAREHGTAVAIGHPHQVTVSTLRAVLPSWRAADVEVVPVSQLVEVPTLAPK